MHIHKGWTLATGSIAALALFAAIGSIAVIALTVFVLFFILAMERPKETFYAFIVFQLVVPGYVVIPPIGFLPNLPVSMLPLGGILTVCMLENLLKPESAKPKPAKMDVYGRVLITALYLFAIISLASLTDEKSSRESFMLWIRAVAIPLSICWAGIKLLDTVDDIHKLFNMLMFSGLCASGFAVSEYLMGRNILIEKLIMSTDNSMRDTMSHFYHSAADLSEIGTLIYRCSSVFSNAIEFGSFMTMVFPFPLIVAVLATGKRRRLYGFIAALCLLGVLLSFSRGPILTSVLQIFGLALLLRPLRRVVINSIIVMALSVTLTWPMIGDTITNRFKDKDNVTLRFKLWEIGLHMFADNPILGVGLGNFPSYQKQVERDYRVGPILEWGGDIDDVATVDNTYIQLAAETGSLGFGSFMSIILVYFSLILRLYQRSLKNSDTLLQALTLGSGFGAFGYFFNALTYTALGFFVVTPTLFLLYATVIVLERRLNSIEHTFRLQPCA